MNYKLVLKIISILILIISGFMIIPAILALHYGEKQAFEGFVKTIIVSLSVAFATFLYVRKIKRNSMSSRDGFLFVTMSWVIASLIGALPYYFSNSIPTMAEAYFETMSGFTTTGASILNNIEGLPKSMLFWRALTHWLGGMGIVVLTVAILPLLGIGGLQLIKAEAPGPTVDKITPRITETAKLLWYIYMGYTVLETILLMFGGMDLFDATTHTFATLATGGFSTKNGSVGQFNSAYIDGVITIFMVLAGINFTLHFRILTGRFKYQFRYTEVKVYLAIFFVATIIITITTQGAVYKTFAEAFRYSSFQVASIITTTGFATADYLKWPAISQAVIFLLMFIGGSSGSTGGGIKVIRIITLFKQGFHEMKYLLHPRGIFTLKISGSTVKKDIVYAISGFFFLYMVALLVVTLVVTASGIDLFTSFTTALATVGNIGPGFAKVGPAENYSLFSPGIKWFLSFAMLAGRLELYTVLVLFTPMFWRR